MKAMLNLLLQPAEYIHKNTMPVRKHFSKAISVRTTLALSLTGLTLGFNNPIFAQSTAPLLQQSNLEYQGAFRVPQGTTDTNTFNYGGTSLAFNPANNSLFMIGHDWNQLSAEIKVPTIVNSASISGLNTATILQQFKDPTEGKLNSINPSDSNPRKVGGQMVYNGNLYVTGYSYYDGAGTQSTSQFVRPLNLATAGQVKGPYKVGTDYPGFVSGYMTPIPPEWQSSFGGPALVGNCCLAVAGLQSNGPAASVFNPENIGKVNPVPATPVVGYPSDHPLGTGWSTTNSLYNGTTQIRGIVFPPGTRSVLFIGRHGVGTFCYGTGAECKDPQDDSKGVHAYPYRTQIWAYDANDLVGVRDGTKQRWQIQPYAVWNITLPFGATSIGGAVYDPQSSQLYISQMGADSNSAPVIHVFKVQTGSPSQLINPPTNVQIK